MDSKTVLLILKNKAKLSKMIEENQPYEKIVKQSQRLDKYIIKGVFKNLFEYIFCSFII